MGWFISYVLLAAGIILSNEMMLVAAGIFSISGAISFGVQKVCDEFIEEEKEEKE